MSFELLVERAKSIVGERALPGEASAGSVAAALMTDQGNVYTGVCIDVPCGIGFCAEHAAIAAMITAGESRIRKIVALTKDSIVAPCGRCREFVNLVHEDNRNTEIMVSPTKVVTLGELLPFPWIEEDPSLPDDANGL